MNLPLINSQFTAERANEQAYRALQSSAEAVNWPGAAAFFANAAEEEGQHAERVKAYIIDRNETPVFEALPAITPIDGKNYAGMFQKALELEKANTARLNALWVEADDTSPDPQTVAWLTNPEGEDWPGFIAEQTISERELVDLLAKIERLGPDGLETFDQWLAEKFEA